MVLPALDGTRRRHGYADGLGNRRVAQAGVRAALVGHLEFDDVGPRRPLQGHLSVELLVVDFHLAEKLVGLPLAVRHRDRARGETWRFGLHCHTVPIQVVAVGNDPVEGDCFAAIGRGGQLECLVRRQEFVIAGDPAKQALGRSASATQARQAQKENRDALHVDPVSKN
jgi:hypothetical protein